MGGLIIGMLWGTLVSALILVALSLSSPLPERAQEVLAESPQVVDAPAEPEVAPEDDVVVPPEATPEVESPPESADPQVQPADEETAIPATEVPLPSGSEFNRPPPEQAAIVPSPDAAPRPALPEAPVIGVESSTPRFDNVPPPQPNVVTDAPDASAAPESGAAPNAPTGLRLPTTAEAPNAPAVPSPSAEPDIRTARLPQTTPAIPRPGAAPEAPPVAPESPPNLAEEEEEEESVRAPEAEDEAPTVQALPPAGLPDAPAPLETAPSVGSAAQIGPNLTRPNSSLPQVGGNAPDLSDAPLEAEVIDEPEDPRAIAQNAMSFERDGRPLMSVILIDEPNAALDLDTLTRFTFPVTFALDWSEPGASDRAAAYRAAGFEVAILANGLPDGAEAVDVEVAFEVAQQNLPEAVALLDTQDGRLQSNRPLLDAMIAALADTGHGLVAFPQGLNAAEQTAARSGVPGATLFRLLDGEEEAAPRITRYLSRAAFAAVQEGHVIVVGHTRPDTVTALLSWALAERSGSVQLAPLSATLLSEEAQP
ncbi:divergent polysaccharide deacetylase family protein [Gymnodinialimonas sp. 2305UL16-5]|uniref:divergent polysaccharide deacetylase family protein n=1 Tax=Gymnodinialimonas mytili TaxID=3126503 RepID=UPI00309F47A5